ncbi:MAG TPA: excinuclease ABC subunit B [Lentisphaeria bacterium]|nr:MAG: excinuclease ABC subunit B [Lentisphaerae bacterium GWF2_38_69]HBM17025.1 excinuclease ABC subunit B [Lentisphaeria bacterium]
MFKLVSKFDPAGDQQEAINKLVSGLKKNQKEQTLLGVTGSGKTFTMANVIDKIQKPALVISHNKTLAAQLFSEFKAFFPGNAVEYFISYYDYYLPESYIPQTDTYIAKDSSVNEEIERLRLSATASLMTRKDVIIIASVSCIYGLGSPEDFKVMSIELNRKNFMPRKELLDRLVNIQYERNDIAPTKGQFRVKGETVDIYSPVKDEIIRVEYFGDETDKLSILNTLTAKKIRSLDSFIIPPVKHFVLPRERILSAEESILSEINEQVKFFEKQNKFIEAQRIFERTRYDLEMMKEIGYCSGIENYSRHLAGRPPGSRPYCLLDYLEGDFLLIIDESHATIPQLRAMYNADRSRKQTLVDFGFRLPSALDNRPLNFEEFNGLINNVIYVSATPGDYEVERSLTVAEQVVRPTGLLDPEVIVRPLEGQIDDIIAEVRARAEKNERTLVTTLTKASSEKLADYLVELGVRAKYLHSELDAIKRVEILNSLRKSEFDCLIGVNLLREGLDLPEVSLVAILDADKEGFLRSEKSLIQVAGRAARNVGGQVIVYADKITPAIDSLIKTTEKRRKKQLEYNKAYGITPKTIVKELREDIKYSESSKSKNLHSINNKLQEFSPEDMIELLRDEMIQAAEALEFERAAQLRDKIKSFGIKLPKT